MIQVKKFPKVSLLCRKIICSNSQSIQVQVYSLNLYYMNKLMEANDVENRIVIFSSLVCSLSDIPKIFNKGLTSRFASVLYKF